MNTFEIYAQYYDLLYGGKDYDGEARYVERQLRRYATGPERILELGCGTGLHAVCLAEDGFEVVGVDLSDGMLAQAERRRAALPDCLKQRLRFVNGDIRLFRTVERFHAVVSLFHVLSYQRSNGDLRSAIATAGAHLDPGGLFAFDFWYGPAVLSQRPHPRLLELENERVRVTRIAQPALDANCNLVEVNYRIIVEDKESGRCQKIQEAHVMRYLFLPELDGFLEQCGMRRLCAHGWLTDDEPSADTWSAFVVAIKGF